MDNEKQFYYSNVASIESSNYDFKLNFGRIKGATNSEKVDIDKAIELEVCMSPQHVKAFAYMLMQNIQQYEEVFGEISIQPKESL